MHVPPCTTSLNIHYENTPIQIYRKFHLQKLKNFGLKTLIVFIFLLKSIDCGYSLEPPRRGDSNEYTIAEAVLTSTDNLCF